MSMKNINTIKTLTVFTPTYNRAHTLNRCYRSLVAQTSKDFVWMVIDDGSTDNTKELIDSWKENDNGFEIKYVFKQNGGMHTAHNTAYELTATELNVCIDSDDYMPENAVEEIVKFWSSFGSPQYSGIVALNITKENKIVGTKLPEQTSIRLSDFYAKGGKGDKKLIYRTDVMRRYPPYPVFEGEKYVGLKYKYILADQDYELLVMNKPVCIVEYMEDGSTKNMFRQYLNNPRGFAFIRKVDMQYDRSHLRRFVTCIHYVSSSILSRNIRFLKEAPKKIITLVAVPFGIMLYALIKVKTLKGSLQKW